MEDKPCDRPLRQGRTAMGNRHTSPIITALIVVVMFTFIGAAAQDNVEWVRGTLKNPNFKWTSRSNDRVCLYAKENSFASKHGKMLLRSATDAIDDALAFVGRSDYENPLTVFYVDTREEMKELVGHPVTGYAVWSEDCVFLVCSSEWRSFDTHEIAHVVSINTWEFPNEASRWMLEGVPILVDGWCAEYTVDEIVMHLLKEDELPGIDVLMSDFRNLGEVRAGVCAASVIDYIRDTYGVAAVKTMWTEGPDAFTRLLDVTIEDLESGWRKRIKNAAERDVDVDWEMIGEKGCG